MPPQRLLLPGEFLPISLPIGSAFSGALLIGTLLLNCVAPVAAQPVNNPRFIGIGEPDVTSAMAAAPRLKTIGASARRVLAQFDALIAPATEQESDSEAEGDDGLAEDPIDEPVDWDEALSLLEELMANGDRTVVPAEEVFLDDEPGRYISLRDACHAKIAALPPEGLLAYRDRVDPAARQLLEAGRERNQTATLRRVVDEYFCSSWADEALLLLGDLALERGDTLTARRCWRRITPLVSDPAGRPLAWSLRGIDLRENGESIRRIVNASAGVGLLHPDSDIPIGHLFARLALASLYGGERGAAATYASLLQLLAPDASGFLAGRSGPLAEIVGQLLKDSEAWPAATEMRIGRLVGPVWPRPIALSALPVARTPPQPRAIIVGGRIRFAPQPANQVRKLTCRPTVAGDVLVYRDGPRLNAVDLMDGSPTLGPKGVLHSTAIKTPPATPQRHVPFGRQRILRSRSRLQPPPLPSDEPMTVVGDRLLARVVARDLTNQRDASALLAFDLKREGLESPVVKPIEQPWQIGGSATADASRAYLPIVNNQTAPQLAIAAYSHTTSRELWRTQVATGQATSRSGPVVAPRVRIVRSGETLLLNTNLGAVAALDRQSGAMMWVRLYDRTPVETTAARSPPRSGEAACLVAAGRVFVAPADSRHVFCLDAATGRLLWATPLADENTKRFDYHLLGVADRTLVIGGDQLRGFDIDTGQPRYTWPESRKAGIRGAGRGCLVAGEVFWPTRNRILTFDAQRGAQTRGPIDIQNLGGEGAYLVPAGELLVAAGVKAMTVIGPINREEESNGPLLSQLD